MEKFNEQEFQKELRELVVKYLEKDNSCNLSILKQLAYFLGGFACIYYATCEEIEEFIKLYLLSGIEKQHRQIQILISNKPVRFLLKGR